VDGGVTGPTTTFAQTSSIFNGENWTRAAFILVSPVPVFTVSLSAPSGQPVTVNYATANGTAIGGQDFLTPRGTLTFAPGTTTQQLTVPALRGVASQADETYSLNLSSPVNATIGDGQGIATITNDDPAPTLSINDLTVTEGNAGTSNAVFTVSLTGATALTATVGFATSDGTALAGQDYT